MKFTALFTVVMAVLAMFFGAGHANPAPKVPIKQIGKAIKTGLGVLGAAGTAHEVYTNIKNRG
ncbi:uncharacterized protein LOC114358036 [Ostrinia furnacalis]|uniref:uncharacterized protein LOC114358036 n=1 Tax=Ostrinia furnacalis TaxID=93504 RepID=UPI001039860A|nr:uncharacterized protein LOC114358036 [Ostrinia furnacalis]